MLPVSLSIQGFYSYKNEVTIDFTRLMRGGIFGIFGNVGSGKSAILEAMMFALYREVPRMSIRDRNNNMMNTGSMKMKIDFTFKTEQNTYQIIVTATRNKKDLTVNTPDFRHFILQPDGKPLPMSDFDAAKILGLEAKNFLQTVIIPQNDFQRFLQLSVTERMGMIKDIFPRLKEFELSENVKTLEAENKVEMKSLEDILKEIGDVSEEIIKDKKQFLKKTKSDLVVAKKELSDYQKQEAQIRRLKEKIEAVVAIEKDLEKLAQNEIDIEQLRRKIGNGEYYLINIKTLNEQYTDKIAEFTAQQNEIATFSKQLDVLKQKTDEVIREKIALKTDYDRRDEILKIAADYKLFAQIHSAREGLKILDARQTKTNETAAQFVKQKQTLGAEKLPLVAQQDLLTGQQTDFSAMDAITDWFNQYAALKKDRDNLIVQKNDLDVRLEGLNKRKIDYVRTQISPMGLSQPQNTKIVEWISFISTEKENLLSEVKHLETKLISLLSAEKLETLADSLQEGKPCPLCGAVHHPNKLNPASLHHDLDETKKQLEKNNRKIATFNNFEIEFKSMKEFGDDFLKQKKQIVNALSEAELKIKSFEQDWSSENGNWFLEKKIPYPITGTEISEEVIFDFEIFKKIRNEKSLSNEKLKKIKVEITNAEKKIKLIETEEENLKKIFFETEKNIAVKENDLKNFVGQLRSLNLSELTENAATDWQKKSGDLENHIQAVTTKMAACEKRESDIKSETDNLRGILSEKNNAALQTGILLKKIKPELDSVLAASPFGDVLQLKDFLSAPFDIVKARKQTADFDKNKLTLQTRLSELTKETKGEKFDADVYLRISDALKQSVTQNELITGQIAVAEEAIIELMRKSERAIQINLDLTQRKQREVNLGILKSLFTKSGFVNYASTQYLKNLCFAANKRFQLFTRQFLRLDIDENNDFIVREMITENGLVNTRSVRTLSGGQTFQAALSLALALSEVIQATTNTNHNFFFLDEGFGSLDKESLAIVFETLKQLQKENRIVGVISHVEEMQQEIDNYLLVRLDEERGSIIETDFG